MAERRPTLRQEPSGMLEGVGGPPGCRRLAPRTVQRSPRSRRFARRASRRCDPLWKIGRGGNGCQTFGTRRGGQASIEGDEGDRLGHLPLEILTTG